MVDQARVSRFLGGFIKTRDYLDMDLGFLDTIHFIHSVIFGRSSNQQRSLALI
jgi:hypothetical protein